MSTEEAAARVAADCGTSVEETARCEEHLAWAEASRLVRVSSSKVPDTILPDTWKAELIDLRVAPPRRGPPTDDAVYESNREVWDKVSRGNCFLRLTTPHRGKETFVACRALRKFTGGPGDDDDKDGDASEQAWMTFFSAPPSSCDTVVSMAKVNGEAAHWAARIIPAADGSPVTLHFVGSKNVHLLLAATPASPLHDAAPAQLAAYGSENRFRMAGIVAKAVLARASPEVAVAVAGFMDRGRVSANFELVTGSYQHVVPYASHSDPNDDLYFCCWTANRYYTSAPVGTSSPDEALPSYDSATCLEPAAGLAHAAALGLKPCDFDVVPGAACEEHAAAVRGESGSEGRVLYFVRDGACVGLQKRKSIWYILLRAVREKSKGMVSAYQRALKENNRAPSALKQGRNRKKSRRKKPGVEAGAGTGAAAAGPLKPEEREKLAKELAREWRRRTGKRIREVQSWTGLSAEGAEWWTARAAGFIGWLADEMVGERVAAEDVGAQFVSVMIRHFGSEEELLNTRL